MYLNFFVPDKMHLQLKVMADQNDRSMAAQIRNMIKAQMTNESTNNTMEQQYPHHSADIAKTTHSHPQRVDSGRLAMDS